MVLLSILGLWHEPAIAQVAYRVTLVGDQQIYWTGSEFPKLNDLGEVAGTFTFGFGSGTEAFLWRGGKTRRLQPIGTALYGAMARGRGSQDRRMHWQFVTTDWFLAAIGLAKTFRQSGILEVQQRPNTAEDISLQQATTSQYSKELLLLAMSGSRMDATL
jgi:hypothetical protein